MNTKILIWLIGFSILQSLVLAALFLQYYQSAAVLHFLTGVCLILSFNDFYKNRLKKGRSPAAFFYISLLIVFMPGVGWLGALLFLLVLKVNKSSGKDSFDHYESYPLEGSPFLVSLNRTKNFWNLFQQEINFEPFIDLLLKGDVKIKAMVIKKLSKEISRDNIRLLKIALQDTASEVRLYAAGALVEIESQLNERMEHALNVSKKYMTFKSYVELGESYKIYAESGLVEKILAQYYWRQAAQAYKHALDQHTDHPEVVSSLAKCLIAMGEYQNAKTLLEKALLTWDENTELLILSVSVDFELGMFRGVSEKFRKINNLDLDELQKAAYDFWCSGELENQSILK